MFLVLLRRSDGGFIPGGDRLQIRRPSDVSYDAGKGYFLSMRYEFLPGNPGARTESRPRWPRFYRRHRDPAEPKDFLKELEEAKSSSTSTSLPSVGEKITIPVPFILREWDIPANLPARRSRDCAPSNWSELCPEVALPRAPWWLQEIIAMSRNGKPEPSSRARHHS